MIAVSQSRVAYELLKQLGQPGAGWGMSYDEMPDSGNAYITAFETEGTVDGVDQKTGEAVEHPGLTVTVRHPDAQVCRQRAAVVCTLLERARGAVVAVDAAQVLFWGFNRTSGLVRMGEDGKRRERYNINGTVTLSVLE